jgi:hypothetical protein
MQGQPTSALHGLNLLKNVAVKRYRLTQLDKELGILYLGVLEQVIHR